MVNAAVITTVGVLTYLCTCWTLFLTALFLVYPPAENSDNTERPVAWKCLAIDASLLIVFVLQHTLLASNFVKGAMERRGLSAVQRSVYVASTSAVLQLVVRTWQPVSCWYLWKFSAGSNVQFGILLLHGCAWFTMACSCLALDYPELIGMKQIYYSVRQLENPMDYKSPTVRRLYSHCRHPILMPLLVLTWATVHMSFDRLVLAVAMPLYLVLRSKLDWEDAAYVQEQFERKQMKLHCQ